MESKGFVKAVYIPSSPICVGGVFNQLHMFLFVRLQSLTEIIFKLLQSSSDILNKKLP